MSDARKFLQYLQNMRKFCEEMQQKEGIDNVSRDYWETIARTYELTEKALPCYFDEEDLQIEGEDV